MVSDKNLNETSSTIVNTLKSPNLIKETKVKWINLFADLLDED